MCLELDIVRWNYIISVGGDYYVNRIGTQEQTCEADALQKFVQPGDYYVNRIGTQEQTCEADALQKFVQPVKAAVNSLPGELVLRKIA